MSALAARTLPAPFARGEGVSQQGDFHGGWAPPGRDDAIKGAPGTRHW